MIKFWTTALKISGPVAIVGFLFWFLITLLCKESLLNLFGSEQRFILILVIICGLLVCLITALLVSSKTKKNDIEKNAQNHVSFENSVVKGDVVIGSKNITNRE